MIVRIRCTVADPQHYSTNRTMALWPNGIEGSIPRSEIKWHATQLLIPGAEAIVEAPSEFIAAIDQHVHAIAALYQRRGSRGLTTCLTTRCTRTLLKYTRGPILALPRFAGPLLLMMHR